MCADPGARTPIGVSGNYIYCIFQNTHSKDINTYVIRAAYILLVKVGLACSHNLLNPFERGLVFKPFI
jgi:hypothetical protein